VVESTDSWERNDAAILGGLHLTAPRRSLLQGLVNPVLVIIGEVSPNDPSELIFTEHDHMIETLPTNRADESLGVWILPRTSRCCENFLYTHGLDFPRELFAIDPVTIAKEVARRFVPRKRFGQLPSGPRGTWIRCDGKVDNFTTLVPQYDKAVEELKRYGWNVRGSTTKEGSIRIQKIHSFAGGFRSA